MTYIAQEVSVSDGAPCELYEVRYDAQTWYYTSADAPFFDPATTRTYQPLVVYRGNVVDNGDVNRATLELEVERSAEFLDLFRVAPPSAVVSLTVRRVHLTDGVLQIVALWLGRILNVAWQGPSAKLNCEPVRSGMAQFGLRRQFQLQCPHVLYGPSCRASRASFQIDGTVTALAGSQMTVPACAGYGVNNFAGGYIEWTHADLAATERRSISSSSNAGVLEVIGVPVGIDEGAAVRVFPGCDHSLGANGCSKFNNVANYGGFPHTPTKNPFGGDPLY